MSITPTQARSSAGADYKETRPGGFSMRSERKTPRPSWAAIPVLAALNLK